MYIHTIHLNLRSHTLSVTRFGIVLAYDRFRTGSAINMTSTSRRSAAALASIPPRFVQRFSSFCLYQSDPILFEFTSLVGMLIMLLAALLNQFYLLIRECATHPLGRPTSGISPLGAIAVATVRSNASRAPHRNIENTVQGALFGTTWLPQFEDLRTSVPARPLQRTRRWGRAQVRRLWARKSSSMRRRSRHV